MDARHWNGDDDSNPPRCDCGAVGCMSCDEVFATPDVGDHITMPYTDRVLLGEVTGVILSPAGPFLLVRYFNRDPWPVSPAVDAVTVLQRTYAEGDETL